MDDISAKREALMSVYRNRTWAEKVKNMSEAQVVAVYLRLKNQNKL